MSYLRSMAFRELGSLVALKVDIGFIGRRLGIDVAVSRKERHREPLFRELSPGALNTRLFLAAPG